MNEQDKAAFETWLEANNFGPSWVMAENAWQAALQHRDSQPMVRLTEEEIIQWVESGEYNVRTNDWASHIEFANAIMDAHEAKNRGRG